MNKGLFWGGLSIQIIQLLAIIGYSLTLINWNVDYVVYSIIGGIVLIANLISIGCIIVGLIQDG